MRKLAAMTAVLGLAGSMSAEAQTVLTFEDIPCTNAPITLYNGVNFNGMFNCYTDPQSPYTPKSGVARVYDFTSPAMFNFLSPTVFNGAWFSGYSDATVQFALFLGAVPVGMSAILSPTDVPAFLSSGYSGLVDGVQVLSPKPDFFVMDDVTFGTTAVVPEPASMVLLGTGLLGVFGATRRRKNRS